MKEKPPQANEKPALPRPVTLTGANLDLHQACQRGHTEKARAAIANGADITCRNHLGWTPLHEAAFWDRREVAKLLIENGADIEAVDDRGRTPLDTANSGDVRAVIADAVQKKPSAEKIA